MNMVSMAIYLQLYAKPFYIFFSHLKTIQSIFKKFSGDMGTVTLGSTLLSWGVHCYHGEYIAIMGSTLLSWGQSKCSFYGNICHGLVLLWYGILAGPLWTCHFLPKLLMAARWQYK